MKQQINFTKILCIIISVVLVVSFSIVAAIYETPMFHIEILIMIAVIALAFGCVSFARNYINNYFEDKDINLLNEEHSEEIKDNNINTTIDTDINLEKNDIDLNSNINNITNIINNENKYYTYKVYIVREGDTIETICSKYNVNVNDIKEYNNINEINIGDKIIIPQINE